MARLHESLAELLLRVSSNAAGNSQAALEALPLAWRLNALLELATGLAHLHANRVVHGDLKPGNVMLTSPRTGCMLQLTDFGLARECSVGTATLSATLGGGGTRGTVAWMAPELLAAPVPGTRPARANYRT